MNSNRWFPPPDGPAPCRPGRPGAWRSLPALVLLLPALGQFAGGG